MENVYNADNLNTRLSRIMVGRDEDLDLLHQAKSPPSIDGGLFVIWR
jgi:hypothetical protein